MSDLPPPPAAEPNPPSATGPVPPPPPPNLTPPPGYTPYQAAPTPLSRVGRVKGLSVALVILTAVTGVSAIFSAIASPAASDKAKDFLAGRITEDEFLTGYGPVALTQILQSIGTLATAVLTMIWMYRMASNVRAFGRATTWAPIWAIFGWVLPPLLVIIPFLMLREIWKASDPATVGDPDGWRKSGENPMLFLWFIVYGIIPTVLTAVSVSTVFSGGFASDTEAVAEAIEDFGAIELFGTLSTVVAAIVWIVVVRQMTTRHMQLTNER